MHALQFMSLLWWWLSGKLTLPALRLALHWAGLAYLLWVVLLTQQALAGQTAFCLAHRSCIASGLCTGLLGFTEGIGLK